MSSFKEYLHTGITVGEYFGLMVQVTDIIYKAQLNNQLLNYDINSMGINNGSISFQYSAGARNLDMSKIKTFIKDITFECIFNSEENCQVITSFMHFLDDGALSSNLANIQEHCKRQASSSNMQYQTGSVVNNADETGVLDQDVFEKTLNNSISTKLQTNSNSGTFGEDYIVQLVNVKKGEVVPINKDNFWIGKGTEADLRITEEIVSRKHAVIITKNNHYFICDNGSTNKTFVNNKEIPPKASVEIFDGTKIKFATIEYEFRIEY